MAPSPFARAAAPLGRLPRGLRALVGAAALVLGAVIVSRPTTSLGVLAILIGAGLLVAAIVELLGDAEAAGGDPTGGDHVGARPADAPATTRRRRRWRIGKAAVWAAAGVLVLVLPGLTVRLLAVIVGVGLLANGVLSIVAGIRRRASADGRVAAILLGAAELVFGALALLWPDLTLLVVAVVFGARLVVAGILELWHALRGTSRDATAAARAPRAAARRGPFRRGVRTFAATLALALAIGAAALSAALHGGSPVVDDFYAPPRAVPAEPGSPVRAEPFDRGVPEDARAWRILYTTTRGDGSPAVASGIVVVPREGDGPFPVVDWMHGTTGFAENCAPSLAAEPFESGALFLLDRVIDEGWALVATDYLGLGTAGPHPYLVGVDSAHAGLDAARAARGLADARLGTRHVVWGHSQGGGGALWSGALAADYAPGRELAGIAALAPASDLPALVRHLPEAPGGSVFAAYVVAAYTAVYPELDAREIVRPGARAPG